jgi:hypothetical protein
MFRLLKRIFGTKELIGDAEVQEMLDENKQNKESFDRYMSNRHEIKDKAKKGDIEAIKEIIASEDHPMHKNDLFNLAFHAVNSKTDSPSALLIAEQIGLLYFDFYENNLSAVKKSKYNMIYLNMVKLYVFTREFDKAIAACKQAIASGLTDGTKTGYTGRLNRVENQKTKSGIK